MSGSRLTRKVTVEGSKKISDSNVPRKSVFDRLGPGTVERGAQRRDDYHESQSEKCRYWVRDGRCPFGNKCRYNHGSSSETKSKVKIVRSIVSSKGDDSGEGKSEVRVKRFPNMEESPPNQSSKKPKKHKSEKSKSINEHVKEEHRPREPREHRKDKETEKAEKKKDVTIRRSLSSSGWNLQDQSESDEATDGKQMDWEERGALNYDREVALEERRNDLRRQIAKIDQHVDPVVTMPNTVDTSHLPRADEDPSPIQISDVKPEKKKKTKSEKSKKKSKKKSHKSDVTHVHPEHFRTGSESSDKIKKSKSPVIVKKKKKHDSHAESEFLPSEVLPKTHDHQRETPQYDISPPKRASGVPRVETVKDHKSKTRHTPETKREKVPRLPHDEQPFEEDFFRLDDEKNRKKQKASKIRADKRSIGRRGVEERDVEGRGLLERDVGRDMQGRGVEAQGMEERNILGRDVEGRYVEGRSVEGRSMAGRGGEDRGMAGRGGEDRGMAGRDQDGRGGEGRSMAGRDVEGRGGKVRGMPGRDVEDRTEEGRSMPGRDVEGRGWESRGMPGRGVEERGREGRGVPGRELEGRAGEGRDVERRPGEGRGRESRGIPGQDVEERGGEGRDVEKRAGEGRGRESRGMLGRDVEERGGEGRAMPGREVEERGRKGRSMAGRDVGKRAGDGRGGESRGIPGRNVEERDMEGWDVEGRDVEERDVEVRGVPGRDVDGRSFEERDIEGRNVERRNVDRRNADRQDMGGRGIEGRSIDRRFNEGRVMEKHDMKERIMEGRGVDRRGMEGAGVDRRGMEGAGVDRRGIEGRNNEGRRVEAQDTHDGEGRNMEEHVVEERRMEEKNIGERGKDRRSTEGRRLKDENMEGRSMEGRGVQERGSDGRSIERRAMEERDVEERGVDVHGVDMRSDDGRSFDEPSAEERGKENRVRKKAHLSRTDKGKQRVEEIAVARKSEPRFPTVEQKSEKRHKKHEKQKKSAASVPLPENDSNNAKKSGMQDEGRKARGPRTPSPDIKQSPILSRNIDSSRDVHYEPHIQHTQKPDTDDSNNITMESHVSPLDVSLSQESKFLTETKQFEKEVGENSSVSSASETESSEQSPGCDVESVSGEEQQTDNVLVDHSQEVQNKRPDLPGPKHDNRGGKLPESGRNRDYTDRAERSSEEPKDQSFNEGREEPEDKERLSEFGRREERTERHHREQRAREHRRPRDEEPERRSQKDPRDVRESRDFRDHRDTKDYREMPRIDSRESRERYHELSERERERHPTGDVHRNEATSKIRDRGGKAGYGRGGWSRDRHGRGRGGYSSYDSRGSDDRRAEGRPVQERPDRGYPPRGSRYRDVNERHNVPSHDRRSETNYREQERERERFSDSRFYEDTRGARQKRFPRASPEGGRHDRRGYREEQERRPGTPLEESEEWDYEEGHSPVAQTKDPVTASRKRMRELSPRSPRSETIKRKKVTSPEQEHPKAKEKMPDSAGVEIIPATEHEKRQEKDSKRPKKDKVKKTRKRKVSESEHADTSENVDTPDRKRKRESEISNRERQIKKSKGKNQPEVVVRPWSDLENDEDDSKAQGRHEKNASDIKEKMEGHDGGEKKESNQVFSDWSDASEENVLNKGENNELTENVDGEKTDEKKDKESKKVDADESVDDVYDPISDDEFEAMFGKDEEESVVKKTTPIAFDEVDWSILGSSLTKKDSEPGDYIKRFAAGKIFSKIGLSSVLAGPLLTKKVQETCSRDAPNMAMKDLLANTTGVKLNLGALVSAEVRKMKERANVVNDIGPCRRGLCARRDFYLRKQLRKLTSTRLGAKLVLSDSSVEPVDSELFGMSVALYKRDKEPKTEVDTPLVPETSEVVVC